MEASAGISTLHRDKIFSKLSAITFDVLIIGGGIMGAGIALDAASRGLKVLLAEKQDFAAGTSSRSTKLIHGGLRYLKNLEFGLVKTVAQERKILHRNAPHLVLPEPMLIPVLHQTSYNFWATKLGLALYDLLGKVAAPERHRMFSKNQTLHQEPLLNPTSLKGAGYFTEYRSDDARLTIEVLKTAQNFGATCLNYTEVTDLKADATGKLKGAFLKDTLTGKSLEVNAQCVINATGPWSAKLMEQDRSAPLPALFHTKGVHLVVHYQKLPLRQSVYFDIAGGRMLFAIPRNKITYLGTTDTPFSGDLQNPTVEKADAEYLLREINKMFPAAKLKPEDVVSSWAGVRTLIFEKGKKPSEISRKDAIFTSPSGLITVAGGKLTGYRKLAEQVVNQALQLHFPDINKPSQTEKIKLAGGDFENKAAVKSYFESCQQIGKVQKYPSKTINYLVQTYGSNTTEILKQASKLNVEESSPESRLLKAEIWYTIHSEGAATISDFLVRRTGKLYFERDQITAILPEVLTAFQEFLQWNEVTKQQNIAAFHALYEAAVAYRKQV